MFKLKTGDKTNTLRRVTGSSAKKIVTALKASAEQVVTEYDRGLLWIDSFEESDPRSPVEIAEDMMQVRADDASGAAKYVPMRFDMQPAFRKVLEMIPDPDYREIAVIAPARMGKTVSFGHVILSYCLVKGIPLGYYEVSDNALKQNVPTVIHDFIRNSPELAKLVDWNPSATNTKRVRPLKGQGLIRFELHTRTGLAGTTFPWTFAGDIDRIPTDNSEGDRYAQRYKRGETSANPKTISESSPAGMVSEIKDPEDMGAHEYHNQAGITDLYNRGNRLRVYFKCKGCGEYFLEDWDTIVQWDDSLSPVAAGESARIVCPHCGVRHDEVDRMNHLIPSTKLLAEGQKIDKDGNITGEPVAQNKRSLSLAIQGTSSPFQTLANIVQQLVTERRAAWFTQDYSKLMVVYNTSIGIPMLDPRLMAQHEDDGESRKTDGFPMGTVPPNVRYISASVDVQSGEDGRFVVQVMGFDDQGVFYLIDRFDITHYWMTEGEEIRCYEIFPSDDRDLHSLNGWLTLVNLFHDYRARIQGVEGRYMKLQGVVIDSGGYDKTTVNAAIFEQYVLSNGLGQYFCFIKGFHSKAQNPRRIWRSDGAYAGVARRKANPKEKGRLIRFLWNINVTIYKTALMQRYLGLHKVRLLKFADKTPARVFNELIAERFNILSQNWEKAMSDRNEALDIFVYWIASLDRPQFQYMDRLASPDRRDATLEQDNLRLATDPEHSWVVDEEPNTQRDLFIFDSTRMGFLPDGTNAAPGRKHPRPPDYTKKDEWNNNKQYKDIEQSLDGEQSSGSEQVEDKELAEAMEYIDQNCRTDA